LRDFTVDRRVWLLTGVALFIGAGAAALAVLLLRAIAFATNAFYYHRLSLAMVGPAGINALAMDHATLHTGLDIILCAEILDQKLLQRNGIVVLRIMAAVDQRDIAATCCFQHGKPRSWIFLEFGKVTPAELIPPRRIVMKPFPKIGAWSSIFQPRFKLQ
jgi:hypothetical protein